MAAADDSITLEVATPTGVAFQIECDWVQAPSVNGELGVLRNHLPLLASLRCGLLRASEGGKVRIVAVGPGFLSAQPEKVEVLTDLYVRAEDVNVDAVKKDLVDAEEKLRASDKEPDSVEYKELERDVAWALAQLDAVAELDK